MSDRFEVDVVISGVLNFVVSPMADGGSADVGLGSTCVCTLGGDTTLGSWTGSCTVGGGLVALFRIWARWMYPLLIALPYVRLGIVFQSFLKCVICLQQLGEGSHLW